jgi:hypothetical protein
MFGAIKRVISGDDVAQQVHAVYAGSNEISDDNMSGERETPQSQQPANTATHTHDASAPPVLVESDPYDHYDDMDEDVHFKHINDDASGAFTTGSELTTDSQDAYNTKMMLDDSDMIIDYTANLIPEPHSAMFDSENFPRNDSHSSTEEHSNRASSQNSSRDWGWFEDVYNAENHSGIFLKRKDQTTEDKLDKKKGKTGGGLVPMVSSEGAHGAVTQIIRTNLKNGRLTVFVCACFLASCSHRLFAFGFK